MKDSGQRYTFQCIGEFVVGFSHLNSMLQLVIFHLLDQTKRNIEFAEVAALVGDKQIKSLTNSVFSLMAYHFSSKWTMEEFEIIIKIRKEVDKIIEFRNRMSHDTWGFGHPNQPLIERSDALLVRHILSPKEGIKFKKDPVLNEKLVDYSSRLKVLTTSVSYFGLFLFPNGIISPKEVLFIDKDGLVQLVKKNS